MKTLCKIKRQEFDTLLPEIVQLVQKPKYLCKKCLRAASQKKVLCKAVRLA